MKEREKKRGQEEMVGFAAVVILVAIIALIILAIAIRKPANQEAGNSNEIGQFLDAMMKVTSECALRYANDYIDIAELLRECLEKPDSLCADEIKVCDKVNQSIKEITSAIPFGEGKPRTGYSFNASIYTIQGFTKERRNEKNWALSSGECGKAYKQAERLISSKGNEETIAILRICY